MHINTDAKAIGSLAGAGLVMGIAKMLASGEKVTWKQALGRAITSGGLGVCAAALTVVFPALSFTALVGFACVISSLGADALQNLFTRILK